MFNRVFIKIHRHNNYQLKDVGPLLTGKLTIIYFRIFFAFSFAFCIFFAFPVEMHFDRTKSE